MNAIPKFLPTGLVALAMLLATAPAVAHHSFAPFDMAKTITLAGVVKELQWTNPHCWIQMVVTDASGKAVEWSIEANSPANLARQGWKRTLLKPGDKITVSAHPLRDGRPGASLAGLTLADGRQIGGSPTPSRSDKN